MKNFDKVKFKWEFRSFQKRVLDNSKDFLSDGKINIVAAPGSGKTILGLELIRRLNSPCIILSPTTTIRHQWGDRFKEAFLDENEDIDEYVSYDLNEITLINSITYQALYSAMNKLKVSSDDEEVDYSNIDLFKLIKESNINTICLDEAHHLQNEWQKALELFIKGLDKNVKIVSLTATPPYDASESEWKRYETVSGTIDDEIFVPELVNEKTLCPHQDYILFSYPTEEEKNAMMKQKNNLCYAFEELVNKNVLKEAYDKVVDLYHKNDSIVFEYYTGVVGLFILCNSLGIPTNKKVFKNITSSNHIPSYKNKYAQSALQFILDINLIGEEKSKVLHNILNEYGLIERKKVNLDFNDKLKRTVYSSLSKLRSIITISKSEYESLGDKLRMLVLTDYIKKEALANIGSDKEFNNISVISIFEELRRNTNIRLGVLSGSIVILPLDLKDELMSKFDNKNAFTIKSIDNTEYGIYTFKGNNKDKVSAISSLFENGKINILIGTQALLGEGWDCLCINSLILASFVGSFMLSNQMRGRAIRTYKNDPNKTSNIWHLVTLEPEYEFATNSFEKAKLYLGQDQNKISSCDFEMLSRRFSSFVGPNYDTGEIENGIERITIIKPPFNKSNIDEINERMLERSKRRNEISTSWKEATKVSRKIHNVTSVPKENYSGRFLYFNILMFVIYNLIASGTLLGIYFLTLPIIALKPVLGVVLLVVLMTLCLSIISLFEYRIINYLSPKRLFKSFGKALLSTLKELDLISYGATINCNSDNYNLLINISIDNATIHEQSIFNQAIRELLSPIENPKYILIKKNVSGNYIYSKSYAVPTIISKKEGTEIFERKVKGYLGNYEAIYAYNESGRKMMIKCRNKSFISKNYKAIFGKQKIDKYEK